MNASSIFDATLPDDAVRFSFRTLSLPAGVTPAVAGLVVGLVTAVIGFVIVALVVFRKRPRREVMLVPPYATLEAVRQTPLPPRVFPPSANDAAWPSVTRPFKPSTELSARALAKMGIPVGPFGEEVPHLCDDDVVVEIEDEPAAPSASVPGSSAPPAPHPLGIIPRSSGVMRATSIQELAFDDSPTEIGEPFFDEPPQPRVKDVVAGREPSRPKIRPVAPSPPRFPAVALQAGAQDRDRGSSGGHP